MLIMRDGEPVRIPDDEFIRQAPERTSSGQEIHSLGRRQIRRLGLSLNVAYIVLPTARALVDAEPGEKIVHVIDGQLRHVRWITMEEAFQL